MQQKKIVFLASDCESSRWVYNALKDTFVFEAAIIENPIRKKTLIIRRIKKIGILKVVGQILFSAIIVPYLRNKAKNRSAELINMHHLDGSPFSDNSIIRVDSVNDNTCKQKLVQLQPDIVIVNGTRIISKNILDCTKAVFINMHVGITPHYRGSHGGYWAVFNKDLENFGTTIHLVDSGVDTGGVLKQVFIKPSEKDNFTTYPVIQVVIGIAALKEVLINVIKNEYTININTEKGKLNYQPTICEYFSS